jgi:hypothetical protein
VANIRHKNSEKFNPTKIFIFMGIQQSYPTMAVQMVNGYDLQALIKEALKSSLREIKQEEMQTETLYTVNEVAKRLHKAHRTVKGWVISGKLRTTPGGLISERALQSFLNS